MARRYLKSPPCKPASARVRACFCSASLKVSVHDAVSSSQLPFYRHSTISHLLVNFVSGRLQTLG